MWCSMCQFIRQKRNSTIGFSVIVRVFFRKSGISPDSPQCWQVPTKYESQLAKKQWKFTMRMKIGLPEVMAAAKTAAWKVTMRRLNHIDLRASSGWSANTADSHSWLRTSSDNPQR